MYPIGDLFVKGTNGDNLRPAVSAPLRDFQWNQRLTAWRRERDSDGFDAALDGVARLIVEYIWQKD